MAFTATNVSVGKPQITGAVFRAPAETSAPTSATAALGGTFADMGYISDEGWTNSKSRETSEIKAWGGDTVLTPQTGKSDTFQMTFIESLNVNVLKAVQGESNVSGTLATGITVIENSKELEEGVWVIDTIMTGGVLKRTVIPHGKVTEVDDVVYKDDEAVGYGVTIQAFPDSTGATHYEYIEGVEESES